MAVRCKALKSSWSLVDMLQRIECKFDYGSPTRSNGRSMKVAAITGAR
jgi:hypothetical protein